jgi:hypothetical protein
MFQGGYLPLYVTSRPERIKRERLFANSKMAENLSDVMFDFAKKTALGGATAVGAQGTVGVAVPFLQSTFGIVVSGVGTLQPAWIGPLAAFSAAPLTAVAVPAAGTTAVVYGVYRAYQYLA